MQLLLNTDGMLVKKKDGAFFIIKGEKSRIVSPFKLSSIAIMGNCLISSAAIRLAIEHDILVLFFDRIGRPEGMLTGVHLENIATLRRQQVLFALHSDSLEWVISLFALKTKGQISNLKFLAGRKPGLKAEIQESIAQIELGLSELKQIRGQSAEAERATILGREGMMSRNYWQAIALAMSEPWEFERRSRQPAENPFNALLNYGYGMLYSVVEGAILAVGLDPMLGIFHEDAYTEPTLAFDLIEPFRPWVDRLILEQFLTETARLEFFESSIKGVFLSDAGKDWWIPLFNAWMQKRIRWNGKQTSRKNQIHRFAGEFAKLLKNWQQLNNE